MALAAATRGCNPRSSGLFSNNLVVHRSTIDKPRTCVVPRVGVPVCWHGTPCLAVQTGRCDVHYTCINLRAAPSDTDVPLPMPGSCQLGGAKTGVPACPCPLEPRCSSRWSEGRHHEGESGLSMTAGQRGRHGGGLRAAGSNWGHLCHCSGPFWSRKRAVAAMHSRRSSAPCCCPAAQHRIPQYGVPEEAGD